MILHDAHNHLQDHRLALHLDSALAELQTMPFGRAVVNGTRESDWDAVLEIAAEHPWITPSLGLHPWYVPEASSGWQTRLEALLESHPRCCVGEIGLDRWIQGHDLDKQRAAFSAQLELAHRYERPATIHCVRAWGALWNVLRDTPLPGPGILLHAYGGPMEMITGLSFATRRTDCQATEARVWVGVKDFRLDEPVRPAVWPAAKKPITTVTMVLVPDVAPVGPLTMTVEGRYACPGQPPVDYRIGPVEMTVAAGK